MKPYFQDEFTTIYHSDCRQILPELEQVDLITTDPPYGVDYKGGANNERDELEGDKSLYQYTSTMRMLTRLCKTDTAIYLFYAGNNSLEVFKSVVWSGLEIRANLIWNKNVAQMGAWGAQYKMKHEPFLYCHLKGESPRWFGPNNEVTVWDVKRHPKNIYHPTQKPVEIFKRMIVNSSKPGDVVLDPFMGSGTALVAAKELGRIGIGIDVEEKYCKVAAERVSRSSTSGTPWKQEGLFVDGE